MLPASLSVALKDNYRTASWHQLTPRSPFAYPTGFPLSPKLFCQTPFFTLACTELMDVPLRQHALSFLRYLSLFFLPVPLFPAFVLDTSISYSSFRSQLAFARWPWVGQVLVSSFLQHTINFLSYIYAHTCTCHVLLHNSCGFMRKPEKATTFFGAGVVVSHMLQMLGTKVRSCGRTLRPLNCYPIFTA